jgi:antitoxin component YwqK of YwqJK toxin-antitoxin module
MKKLILLLSLLLCFVSCKNAQEEYFENGNLFKRYTLNEKKEFDGSYEEYFENGNLKEQHFYKDGIKVDSSTYFYENNPIIRQVDLYLSNDTIIQKNFYPNGNIESNGKTSSAKSSI